MPIVVKQANNLVHVLVEDFVVAVGSKKIVITMVMVSIFIHFDDVQIVLLIDEDVMLGINNVEVNRNCNKYKT